ncbi:ADP-ribosylglycohydrolase family protein [Nocardioides sp. C4-1]|uniref:ADP-ribosylglycohydrolase family protein n=1 Tax=Nocardioides sp. C4-1 TaxID=3151851 RepID=UPI0032659ED4
MATAISQVVATRVDLTDDDALDEVALGFLRWFDHGPPDIGLQTSAVLGATRRRLDTAGGRPAAVMTAEATAFAQTATHSAGNGALMRTGPVALAHLDDRDRLALAARRVAALTHVDPLATESCVLWCEAIRVAVVDGRLDVRAGLDLLDDARRPPWQAWLDEAEAGPASRFNPNGFTVTALQAAVAAVAATDGLEEALHAAVRVGNDTDTVAAITGALVGAQWGASAVPSSWREVVHGWPGHTGDDLVALAVRAVDG